MPKRYDREYFDRWYRDPARRMWSRAAVQRKVSLVLGVAERLLERPARSVLDVGCGEGSWQPVLKRLRPALRYRGVDDSPYAVGRFGGRRNIVRGSIGRLEATGIADTFDVVVCCDVLHYLPTPDVRRGLRFMADRCGALAYLEAYAAEDDIEGDRSGFQRRSAADYRALFSEAGFRPVGMHCYVTGEWEGELCALEKPDE